MQVKIIADENVNFNIVKKLRRDGFDVYSILENDGGINDKSVISITKKEKAILLTEDSDFGEWVFAHGVKDICVIFTRYHYSEMSVITKHLLNLLHNEKYDFKNNFFVLTTTKMKVKTLTTFYPKKSHILLKSLIVKFRQNQVIYQTTLPSF